MRARAISATAIGFLAVTALIAGCLDRELKPLDPCRRVRRRARRAGDERRQGRRPLHDRQLELDGRGAERSWRRSSRASPASFATGDKDGDGTSDFPPVRSLHAGVVTSDMGSGGFVVPHVQRAELRRRRHPPHGRQHGVAGCVRDLPDTFLDFMPAHRRRPDDVRRATLAASRSSAPAAVASSSSSRRRSRRSRPEQADRRCGASTWARLGHADNENAGLPPAGLAARDHLVTDEDDCSAADPDSSTRTSGVYMRRSQPSLLPVSRSGGATRSSATSTGSWRCGDARTSSSSRRSSGIPARPRSAAGS